MHRPVPPHDRGTRKTVRKAVLTNLAWALPRVVVLLLHLLVACIRLVTVLVLVTSGDPTNLPGLPGALDGFRDVAAEAVAIWHNLRGGAG